MIEFLDNTNQQTRPFKLLQDYYDQAVQAKQIFPEAISISSYDIKNNFVDSRYVNLKFVQDNKLIFFSNYESSKAKQFEENRNGLITALIFWNSINIQIRIRGIVKKTDTEYSDNYFRERSKEKNALAISSNQSKKIESYEKFKEKYIKALKNNDLSKRPQYWGGYKLTPMYFEFWKGNKHRINHREVFELIEEKWKVYFLQP